jgi:hypothetical protein
MPLCGHKANLKRNFLLKTGTLGAVLAVVAELNTIPQILNISTSRIFAFQKQKANI